MGAVNSPSVPSAGAADGGGAGLGAFVFWMAGGTSSPVFPASRARMAASASPNDPGGGGGGRSRSPLSLPPRFLCEEARAVLVTVWQYNDIQNHKRSLSEKICIYNIYVYFITQNVRCGPWQFNSIQLYSQRHLRQRKQVQEDIVLVTTGRLSTSLLNYTLRDT